MRDWLDLRFLPSSQKRRLKYLHLDHQKSTLSAFPTLHRRKSGQRNPRMRRSTRRYGEGAGEGDPDFFETYG